MFKSKKHFTILFVIVWTFCASEGLFAKNCFLALIHKLTEAKTRGLLSDEIELELAKLQAEFPIGSKHMETIHKRHRKFTELLSAKRFDSVEKLLAATKHFYGDKKFDLIATVATLKDRIILKKDLSIADFSPDKKGKILLSQEVPTTPEAYQNWLSQISKSLHHAEIHHITHSLSTNPFAKNGTWIHQYKPEIENAILDREEGYRAFIARLTRVYPTFKDEFPEKAPDQSWQQYTLQSARHIFFLTHPWTVLRNRPLAQEESPLATTHQLYWPRWIAANQARITGVIGGSATILFAGFYYTLDEEELEELAKKHSPEFVKFLFTLDTKKISAEHEDVFEGLKEKRIQGVKNRLKEIEANIEANQYVKKELIDEKESLLNELKELGEI